MTAEVHWPQPPVDGYSADDLDRLPDLPAHTELVDGSLVFVSPQRRFHMYALRRLEYGLLRAAPGWAHVAREVTIRIAYRQRPEPDLIVLRADAFDHDNARTYFPADAVILAIEVISPESEIRDRERKPAIYAQAGIEHFWIVEQLGDDACAISTHRLDPDAKLYRPTGIQRDQLQLTDPFPIEIDLTDLSRR